MALSMVINYGFMFSGIDKSVQLEAYVRNRLQFHEICNNCLVQCVYKFHFNWPTNFRVDDNSPL